MGKGSRKRKNTLAEQERLLAQMPNAERRRRRKRQALITAAVCVLAAAVLVVGGVFAWQAVLSDGVLLRSTVAASSASYTVDNAMITCFVSRTYQSYLQSHSQYLDYINLDTSRPLSEQEQSSGVTWLAYFEELTREEVEGMLVFAEGAKAAGITLTDTDTAAIEQQLAAAELSSYGRGIQADDLRRCLELTALAARYEEQISSEEACTKEEAEQYFEQNRAALETVDYLEYSFDYTDEEGSSLMSGEQAKDFAQALSETDEPQAFTAWVKAFLEKYSNYTAAELAEALEDMTVKGEDHREGDAVSDWLFSDGTALYDTYIEQDTEGETVTVYMLTSLAARDESKTETVRHILITPDTAGSEEAAEKRAEELLAEWQSGERSEESFAALAAAYSEDSASAAAGGLYENIRSGQTEQAFEDWCFDPARQTGDTGIVETSYGFHVMYFAADGLPAWRADVETLILNERYTARLSTLKEQYPVTFYDDAIARIAL